MIKTSVVEKEMHNAISNCKHPVVTLVIILTTITINCIPLILTISGSSSYPTLPNSSSGVLTSKGSQFCCSPPKNPNVDYIATTKSVYQMPMEQDAEELRADINGLFRRVQAPKPNYTRQKLRPWLKSKGIRIG